jgi:DNA-binding CsgD family transcriptional regulator
MSRPVVATAHSQSIQLHWCFNNIVIATSAGIVPSFELNRRWVWSKRGSRSLGREIGPLCVLSFAGLGLSTLAVAALIAAGCSNRTIADELSISERTVESHVTAILATLELDSRAQVAAWAVEHGMVDTAAQ